MSLRHCYVLQSWLPRCYCCERIGKKSHWKMTLVGDVNERLPGTVLCDEVWCFMTNLLCKNVSTFGNETMEKSSLVLNRTIRSIKLDLPVVRQLIIYNVAKIATQIVQFLTQLKIFISGPEVVWTVLKTFEGPRLCSALVSYNWFQLKASEFHVKVMEAWH